MLGILHAVRSILVRLTTRPLQWYPVAVCVVADNPHIMPNSLWGAAPIVEALSVHV